MLIDELQMPIQCAAAGSVILGSSAAVQDLIGSDPE